MRRSRTPRPVADRFWAKVDFDGPVSEHRPDLGPCHLWTGATRTGYGRFWVEEKTMVQAHRWAYEQERGPIPDGLEPDHLCRVRACVRTDHLEIVTRAENTRRGNGPASATIRQRAISECPEGHAYTPENTLTNNRGARVCRRCNRDRCRLARQRKVA